MRRFQSALFTDYLSGAHAYRAVARQIVRFHALCQRLKHTIIRKDWHVTAARRISRLTPYRQHLFVPGDAPVLSAHPHLSPGVQQDHKYVCRHGCGDGGPPLLGVTVKMIEVTRDDAACCRV